MRPPPALWRAIAIPVLISTAAGAGAPPILTASDVEPTLLDSLSIDGELLAAAVSPSGERAALAYRSDDPKTERSLLRLLALDREPPATVELPGLVRDLLFAVDGSGTFVIVFKPVRREQGRSALMWIGFDDPRPSNVLRLPPTAASLDYWAADRSLIVSARNELSTIRLDGLRSGRLFRVPGDNHSVVTLGSSSLVLVGQADRILLIDLDDPPGEEEIAPRDSVPVDAPVIELAAAPNGAHALARLADGRAYRVRPWPLELTALNPASAVVAAGKTGDRRPFDPPPPAPGSDATATDGARVTTTAERVATPPVERSATPTSPPSETGVA
ncbi:MAG TPA: hypothetical protein VD788_08425, partial [Candidatus Polarisedimenticolaceae bacterium]|nr:hypothetical protein [Candidatus Polarisedimenticolaceae bacterium]